MIRRCMATRLQRSLEVCPSSRKSPLAYLIGASAIILLALTVQSLRAQTAAQLDRDAILHHLNTVITWYRDATTKIKSVGLPSDAIYQDNARNLASEAVRLAFQSARAEANMMIATDKAAGLLPPPAAGTQPTQQQNLVQTAAKIAAQIDDTQSKLDDLNKQLATAPRS